MKILSFKHITAIVIASAFLCSYASNNHSVKTHQTKIVAHSNSSRQQAIKKSKPQTKTAARSNNSSSQQATKKSKGQTKAAARSDLKYSQQAITSPASLPTANIITGPTITLNPTPQSPSISLVSSPSPTPPAPTIRSTSNSVQLPPIALPSEPSNLGGFSVLLNHGW